MSAIDFLLICRAITHESCVWSSNPPPCLLATLKRLFPLLLMDANPYPLWVFLECFIVLSSIVRNSTSLSATVSAFKHSRQALEPSSITYTFLFGLQPYLVIEPKLGAQSYKLARHPLYFVIVVSLCNEDIWKNTENIYIPELSIDLENEVRMLRVLKILKIEFFEIWLNFTNKIVTRVLFLSLHFN